MVDHEVPRLLPTFPVGSRADLQLRDQLRAIRDGTDQDIRELIDDVLAGRASLRDLIETRFFLDHFQRVAADQEGRARLRADVAKVVEEVPDPLARLREAPET